MIPLHGTVAAAGPVTGLLGAAGAIATPQIRYLAILPEIVMLGGAVLLLGVASLVRRPLRITVATVGTVVISGTSLGLALWQWADVQAHGPYTSVDKAVVVDGFSALVAILVPCAMLLTALVGDGYLRREGVEGAEFHVLAMVSASGAMLMGEANDLIIVFLGLEILSIALYVLAAFNHRRAASGEAALKYFILGGFSSAIFLYGIALTYGATGSTNLTQIADFLSRNVVASDGLLLAGLALLLVGFSFKIAAVPFHMWTPDVYQGSPSPVTGFMAAVAKIGAFAALLRVFVSSFGVLRADWQPVVYALAVVTLLLGAALAVVQRDVKRMLAYSSINHAGFILLGLEAVSRRGVSAAMYYLFAYTFMVIGTFAIVTVLGREGDGSHDIASYRGLARRQPVLALCLAVLLLAQAGAPFTTGLWAKLQVVLAAVDANSVPLAVIAMVSAAVAAFFYLRVAVLMYTPVTATLAGAAGAAGAAAVAGTEGEAGTVGAAGEAGVEDHAEDPEPLPAGHVGPSHLPGGTGPAPVPHPGDGHRPTRPLWDGTERAVALMDHLNAGLLLDGQPVLPSDAVIDDATDDAHEAGEAAQGETPESQAPDDEPEGARVRVPPAAVAAIGLCVGVTVVFGVWPAPLVDLAHKATLLFIP